MGNKVREGVVSGDGRVSDGVTGTGDGVIVIVGEFSGRTVGDDGLRADSVAIN